uniref:C-type lectin domain-containing protein n=1 Tax=Ciona intestinalis TaxID=7719 RepID=F6TDP5_CIOIN
VKIVHSFIRNKILNMKKSPEDIHCYKHFNGTWGEFYYHRHLVEFSEAQRHCQEVDNSQLAIIKDKATLDRLVGYLPSDSCFDPYFWVGLRNESFGFKWINGDDYDKSIVEIKKGVGNCVSIYRSDQQSSTVNWYPQKCSTKFSYMCYTPSKTKPGTKVIDSSGTTASMYESSTNAISPGIIGLIAALLCILFLVVIFVVVRNRRKRAHRIEGEIKSKNNDPDGYSSVKVEISNLECRETQDNPIYNMDILLPSNDHPPINLDQTSDASHAISAQSDDVNHCGNTLTTSCPTYAVVNKKKHSANDIYNVVIIYDNKNE